VGDREQVARAVAVRARGDETGAVPVEQFIAEVTAEVAERRLPAAAG
jgi:threonyl-tRNA synthetase